MTHEPQSSHALEAAARRRRELRDALFSFEEAISSPAADREAWRAGVADGLRGLAHAFADHVSETEGSGGLYEEMEDIAPHLSAKARRLRDEHPPITEALGTTAARLATPLAEDVDLDALRDDLQRLMGRIVRHRQHGADLVWAAYAVDIGGAG